MNRLLVFLLALSLPLLFGCKPKASSITTLQRKQAASVASEAEFATTLKDFKRASALYRQAAQLCPDTPEYQGNLGMVLRQMGDGEGARASYRAAAKLYRDRYAEAGHPADLLQQATLLILMGDGDGALKLLKKGSAAHPDDALLRDAADPSWLERVRRDPRFSKIAL